MIKKFMKEVYQTIDNYIHLVVLSCSVAYDILRKLFAGEELKIQERDLIKEYCNNSILIAVIRILITISFLIVILPFILIFLLIVRLMILIVIEIMQTISDILS